MVPGLDGVALADADWDGSSVPAIRVDSMPSGHGAPGSRLPEMAGLKTYRRSQKATVGGRSVVENASLPALSISQNGILGSPAWLARFCGVIRKGKACNWTFFWPPLKASSTRP